ncbi:O-antigen ligase family protein [Polaromonas sp.]|uniref:O-antigen ligase family protein n=1 Tax=Polaromonas sp. TaxID=1869339 RepID=UPI0013BE6783|nr:O-antigen ligase family protein [Polaromonas sp.]NDP64971.1 O-antigen ligase family protein [Polaromonas sp.]
MQETISLFILVAGAILAALAATTVMAGTVQLTSRRSHGYLHLIFYAMVVMVALSTFLSGRDLSLVNLNLETGPEMPRHPVMRWTQPLLSLLMLTVAGERILSYWLRREKTVHAPLALLLSYIVFWLGTVAAPAFLGAHPNVSHDYAYPLVIGIAAVLVTGVERNMAFKAARDVLFLFMVASLLLIPFKTGMVLETTYTQGLMPGVPRLAGLAAHAISMAILSQLGLICLLTIPYEKKWLNRLAWGVGLTVLFLAQSKTTWIAFVLSCICFFAVRQGPAFLRRVGDPVRPEFGIASILMAMLAVLAVGLVLMLGDPGTRINIFFNSAEGAQLASLTGRDKIWAIAYDEWQRNPIFGYGPLIWETDFRISIGMPNATHAHNQFMDTLSRSGIVGATALLIYALVLMVMSVRYARESKGLTLALFVLLAMRSVSEVPLSLFGYGPEFIAHLLLLMALAASVNDVRLRTSQAIQGQKYSGAFSKYPPAGKPLSAARTRA